MVKMGIEIFSFLNQNWQNIIVALAIGFLFYFLSNYALRRYITSAERERLKQAKDTILNILESRIINKQDISLDKINNLLKAIDREHSVFLSDLVSPSSLLQDLELQFEKSHHLDTTQKEEYCTQIQNQIKEIETLEDDLKVPKKCSEIIEKIEKSIESKEIDESLEYLELLKKKITKQEKTTYEETESISIIATISLFIITILFIFNIRFDVDLLMVVTIIAVFIAIASTFTIIFKYKQLK